MARGQWAVVAHIVGPGCIMYNVSGVVGGLAPDPVQSARLALSRDTQQDTTGVSQSEWRRGVGV